MCVPVCACVCVRDGGKDGALLTIFDGKASRRPAGGDAKPSMTPSAFTPIAFHYDRRVIRLVPPTHTQTHTQGPAATREVLGEPVGGSSAALGPRGARRPTTLCPSQLGSSSQHAVHSGHHDVLRHSTCPRGPVSQEKTNVNPASDGLDSHRELPWGTLPLPDGVGRLSG